MNSLDLLQRPDVVEIEAYDLAPPLRGIIWVSSLTTLRELGDLGVPVIVNTQKVQLEDGDLGGAYLEDGYWVLSDFGRKEA